jgi:hypothetical protein
VSPIHLFAGPSLFGIDLAASSTGDLEVLGPIKHGDLRRLSAGHQPGVVAIVDGLFHQHLPIGHREIRAAMATGWTVWGLSSMGAIRAAEMASMGMRGFGEVFRRFTTPPGLDDDEVALLHAEDPPYTPVTEPLIHLRDALDTLVRSNAIDAVIRARVTARLKEAWYGDRSIAFFAELLAGEAGSEVAQHSLRVLPDCRVKTRDVIDFLKARAWEAD